MPQRPGKIENMKPMLVRIRLVERPPADGINAWIRKSPRTRHLIPRNKLEIGPDSPSVQLRQIQNLIARGAAAAHDTLATEIRRAPDRGPGKHRGASAVARCQRFNVRPAQQARFDR